MNPFNKNPFLNKNTQTKIIGNSIRPNENDKIASIKENMIKLKQQNLNKQNEPKEIKQPNLQQKIEFLRNLDKW